jgi:hypothetical protein
VEGAHFGETFCLLRAEIAVSRFDRIEAQTAKAVIDAAAAASKLLAG